MSSREFSVGRYFNQDTEQEEWGVFASTSQTWYFPDEDTEQAATELATRLNRTAS
ncbi:hypothetical protein [Alcaligenes faecalis]|uniref:hypothetical protein n=1 Tax=Alcaligenes faecalis TaxID=511 RepID=UPI0015540EDD|nr:hypothetical protein [Alcaligenes faecalis]